MPQPSLNKAEIARLGTPVFRKYGVCRAGLFGSYAREEQHARSDLDFLVEFQGRASLITLGMLKDDLEQTFERSCDVLTYKSVMRDQGEMSKIIRQEVQTLFDER